MMLIVLLHARGGLDFSVRGLAYHFFARGELIFARGELMPGRSQDFEDHKQL